LNGLLQLDVVCADAADGCLSCNWISNVCFFSGHCELAQGAENCVWCWLAIRYICRSTLAHFVGMGIVWCTHATGNCHSGSKIFSSNNVLPWSLHSGFIVPLFISPEFRQIKSITFAWNKSKKSSHVFLGIFRKAHERLDELMSPEEFVSA
jgi:hypothetical protein